MRTCFTSISFVKLTLLGYTDFPSRLATQASTLYSNNIANFLLSMAPEEKHFGLDLSDEVVRGSIVTHNGEILPTAPRPAPSPPNPPVKQPAPEDHVLALTPWQKASREVTTVAAGMGAAVALGKATGPLFMSNVFTAGLAGLIGYRSVWGVIPALHSPLMSVTNAISGDHNFLENPTSPVQQLIEFRHCRCWRPLHNGWGFCARNLPSSSWCIVSASGFCKHIGRIRNHQAYARYVQAYVLD